MLTDSHAHFDRLDAAQLDAQLQHAQANGVTRIVAIGQWAKAGDDTPDERRGWGPVRALLRLVPAKPMLRCTVGIHPHDVRLPPAAEWAELESLCRDPLVRAVGECGLDYHYDHSPREVQRARFADQLDLANALGKPVVVHTREADADTLDLLGAHAPAKGGVIHCFTSNAAMARACLDRGLHVSFSGVVTFKNSDEVRDAARLVPLDRMLIETDSPYLAPVPLRGKKNEPANVRLTAEFLAQLKGVSLEELARVTSENAARIFGP